MSSFDACGSNWCSQSATLVPFSMSPVMVLREIADLGFVSPLHCAGVEAEILLGVRSGEPASSDFSSVVLPTPLRPMSAIFSPRMTLAVKF